MNATWVAIIIAIVAIAIGVFLLIKAYTPIPQANVVGLDVIAANALAAKASAAKNASNIEEINDQLGAVDTATQGFKALAAASVTPSFPLDLDD